MREPWIYSCQTSQEEIEAHLAQWPKHYRRKITVRYGDNGLSMHLAIGGKYVGWFKFWQSASGKGAYASYSNHAEITFHVPENPTEIIGYGRDAKTVAGDVGRKYAHLAYDLTKFNVHAERSIKDQFSKRITTRVHIWLVLLSKGICTNSRKVPICLTTPLAALPKYDYDKSAFRKFWMMHGIDFSIEGNLRRFLCHPLTQKFTSVQIDRVVHIATKIGWRPIMDTLGRSTTVAQFSKNLINWPNVKTNEQNRWQIIGYLSGQLNPHLVRRIATFIGKGYEFKRIYSQMLHLHVELEAIGRTAYGGIWAPIIDQFEKLHQSDQFLQDAVRIGHLLREWQRMIGLDSTHDPILFKQRMQEIAAQLRTYTWTKDKKVIVLTDNAARRVGKLMGFCLGSYASSIKSGNYGAILITSPGPKWQETACAAGFDVRNDMVRLQQCYGRNNLSNANSLNVNIVKEELNRHLEKAEIKEYSLPVPFHGDMEFEFRRWKLDPYDAEQLKKVKKGKKRKKGKSYRERHEGQFPNPAAAYDPNEF